MNKKVKDFIVFVKKECKKHGVGCEIRKVKYVKMTPKVKCSGWFDATNKKLVVAGLHKNWLETFVHEYAHLTQWRDQCQPWTNALQSLELVDPWLNGEEVDGINEHISLIRDLELDNEKRSVKLIKQHNLDIDLNDYIKKANSYIYFYNWIKVTRTWSKPGNSPYTNKRLLKVMPKTFRADYTKLPERIRKVYEQEKI
jgi:hypothetical protein